MHVLCLSSKSHCGENALIIDSQTKILIAVILHYSLHNSISRNISSCYILQTLHLTFYKLHFPYILTMSRIHNHSHHPRANLLVRIFVHIFFPNPKTVGNLGTKSIVSFYAHPPTLASLARLDSS